MSDQADWLKRQLSNARQEVGTWDARKRDTLRSEVSSQLKGPRSERRGGSQGLSVSSDPKPPRG